MKTLIITLTLAAAFSSPAASQINFDTGSGMNLPGLISARSGGVPAPTAPAAVRSGAIPPCEPFSVERTMQQVPVYDQMLTAQDDSEVCYAVAAAHLFTHWNLTSGAGGEMVSPLMLDLFKKLREGPDGQGGGEMTADVLSGMARTDACSLGVAAGSRRSLSVNEEIDMLLANQGRTPDRSLSRKELFESLAAQRDLPRSSCRRVQVQPFTPRYMRTRSVEEANGKRHGVPITQREFREFLSGNTARQPVAVKFNYGDIYGGVGGPHWALIVARQQRGGSCQYLIRNSMGGDQPLVWTDEARLLSTVRSAALLTQ